MSNSPVAMIGAVLRRIRWKFVLPAIAGPLTLGLIHLDRLWMKGAGKWDDMPVTTAHGLIGLVNSPFCLVLASLAGESYNSTLLVFALMWWGSLGWLLDRRLQRAAHLIKIGWARAGALSLGLAVSGMMLLLVLVYVRSTMLPGTELKKYISFILLGPFPRRLLGRETLVLAGVVWWGGFAIYFASKLCRMVARRPASAKS